MPEAPKSTGPSQRLKGKARKLAKEAQKPAPPKKRAPEYVIKISDFLSLADTIRNYKPEVKVPKALGNILDRAIDARRKTTSWYEANHLKDMGKTLFAHVFIVQASMEIDEFRQVDCKAAEKFSATMQ